MSSFTSRRTIENCLISARNIRATACAYAAFSTYAQHVHYPNLELKRDRFHVFHRPETPLTVAVDEGAELKHDVTCLRSAHWSLQSVVPLRSLVNVQFLNSKPTDFTLSTDGDAVHSSQWTKGRSLNMASHVFVHVQSKTPWRFLGLFIPQEK